MNISSNQGFNKDYKKLPKKLQEKFKDRVLLFEKDQYDVILNNHPLKGEYLGYRSINITGDLRAIYKVSGEDIIFVAIDNHSNLYG